MRGEELTAWRQHNAISQSGLAELLGVSRQTVISWEKSLLVARVVRLALLAVDAGLVPIHSYRRPPPGRPTKAARPTDFLSKP
jgi:DNA-binding XRE family transcriptional regulator